MLEFAPHALMAAAVAVAAFSSWTDVKKSEVPLWVLWAVLFLSASAFAFQYARELSAPVSGTVAAAAVVGLLFSQWSLNAAYAKSLFAFSVFFWAFWKATFFLEAFILAFVTATLAKAAYFYVRLVFSKSGRRALAKHWKDGFRRGDGGFGLAATAASAVAYVLTVKAVFWVVANFGVLKSGESLLWIVGFLAVFPFAMNGLEALFPRSPKSRVWASWTAATLATVADVATGTSAAWHALGVSLAFWLGMSAVLLGVTRFMRFYLDAAHSKIIPSSALTEGSVIDRDFFLARFRSGNGSAARPFPEGALRVADVAEIRGEVADVRRTNPGLPDEIKILAHHPLSPYVLVAVAVTAAAVLK